MNNELTPYEEALEKIIELQDLLIEEQKEVLRLMEEVKALKSLAIPDDARQKLHELQVKGCGSSYDTVCKPSICDCRGKAQK